MRRMLDCYHLAVGLVGRHLPTEDWECPRKSSPFEARIGGNCYLVVVSVDYRLKWLVGVFESFESCGHENGNATEIDVCFDFGYDDVVGRSYLTR